MIRLLSLIIEQVGSTWSSCNNWKSSGGTSYWNGQKGRPEISIEVNDSGFRLNYKGKGSGYSISHAKGGSNDSLHQAFNVILCECNPYLMKGGLKPDIDNIKTNLSVTNRICDMNIWIPFMKIDSADIYQVNRRGSMNNGDPGPNSILSQIGKVNNLEGPSRVVTSAAGVTIIEYFVTYTIGKASKSNNNIKK